MPSPSLSILITYFGEKELIRRCVDSLLSQSEGVKEILIYDDCSPTPPDPYLPTSPLIRVFRGKQNIGPSAGRNFLLSQAQGEFIHFHDADDWFLPGWTKKMGSKFPDADLVINEVESFKAGQLLHPAVLDLKKVGNGQDLVAFSLTHSLLIPSVTYRRVLAKRLGGFRESLWQSEDFEFHVRLILSHPRIALVLESLVAIDIRTQSRSQAQSEVWLHRLNALRSIFLDLPPEHYPAFVEAVSMVGSKLYHLGDTQSAGEAFSLALQLGTPSYLGRSLTFRLLAKAMGPLNAEWLGTHYRSLLPSRLREALKRNSAPPKKKAS